MNRRTFLASLAGIAAAPPLTKVKPVNEAVQKCADHSGRIKAVFFVNKSDIIERCEKIRKEAEILASQNYAFTQGRMKGTLDFIQHEQNEKLFLL